MSLITLSDVQKALDQPDFDIPAAHRLMAPTPRPIIRPPGLGGQPRLGGVMLLLYTAQAELHFVLTRRRPDLTAHPGQISFPGGRNEAPEALEVTALRETEEEIGIPAKAIKIMGALTPIYIPPSDFHVYPFVGRVARRGRPSFTPEPGEVAEIIEVPLAPLLAPEVRVEEWRDLGGQHMVVPHFAVNGHKVWGATAIILSEFVERLRGVVSPP